VDVGLVLEEAQMAPGALTGIVDRLVLRTQCEQVKPRSTRERHLEADTPSFGIEPDIAHFPRSRQSEGNGEQLQMFHNWTSGENSTR